MADDTEADELEEAGPVLEELERQLLGATGRSRGFTGSSSSSNSSASGEDDPGESLPGPSPPEAQRPRVGFTMPHPYQLQGYSPQPVPRFPGYSAAAAGSSASLWSPAAPASQPPPAGTTDTRHSQPVIEGNLQGSSSPPQPWQPQLPAGAPKQDGGHWHHVAQWACNDSVSAASATHRRSPAEKSAGSPSLPDNLRQAMEADLQHAHSDTSAARHAAARAQAEAAALRGELTALRHEVAVHETTAKIAQRQLEDAKRRLAERPDEATVKAKDATTAARIAALESELQAERAGNHQHLSVIKSLDSSLQSERAANKSYRAEMEQEKKKVEEALASLPATAQMEKELQAARAQAARDLKIVETRAKAAKADFDKLAADLKIQLQERQKEATVLQAHTEAQREELTESRHKTEALQKSLKVARTEREGAFYNLEKAELAVQQLHAEIQVLKAGLDAKAKAVVTEMEDFKAGELHRAQSLAKAREGELRDARESLASISQIVGPLLRSALERSPDKLPHTRLVDDMGLGERVQLLADCLTAEYHKQSQGIIEKDAQLGGLRMQLESAETALKLAERQAAALAESSNEAHRRQMEDSDIERAALKRELEGAKQNAIRLQAEVEEMTASQRLMKSQYDEHMARRHSASDAMECLQQQLAVATAKISTLEERLRDAQSQALSAERRVAEIETELEQHKDAREAAEVDAAAKTERLKELRAALQDSISGEAATKQQQELRSRMEEEAEFMEEQLAVARQKQEELLRRLAGADEARQEAEQRLADGSAQTLNLWDIMRDATLQAITGMEDTERVAELLSAGSAPSALSEAWQVATKMRQAVSQRISAASISIANAGDTVGEGLVVQAVQALVEHQRVLLEHTLRQHQELQAAQLQLPDAKRLQESLPAARQSLRNVLEMLSICGLNELRLDHNPDEMTQPALALACSSLLQTLGPRVASIAKGVETEASQLRLKLQETTKSHEKLKKGWQVMRADVAKVLEDSEQRVAHAQTDAQARIEAASDSFKRNYEQAVSSLVESRNRVADLERGAADLQHKLDQQTHRLEEAKTAELRIQSLSSELTALHTSHWDTSERLSQAEGKNAATQRALRQVLLETMPARLAKARRGYLIKQLRARRSRDSMQISALRHVKSKLEALSSTLEKKLNSSNRRCSKLSATLAEASAAGEAATQRASKLEALLGRSEDRRILADTERRKASEALAHVKKDAEDLQRKLKAAEEASQELSTQAEKWKKTAESKLSKASDFTDELWRQLEGAEARLRESQATASRLLQKAEAAGQEEAQLRALNQQLRVQLEDSLEAHKGTQAQLRDLQQRLGQQEERSWASEASQQRMKLEAILIKGGASASVSTAQSFAQWMQQAPEAAVLAVADHILGLQHQVEDLLSAKVDLERACLDGKKHQAGLEARLVLLQDQRTEGLGGLANASPRVESQRNDARNERIVQMQAAIRDVLEEKEQLRLQVESMASAEEEAVRKTLGVALTEKIAVQQELRQQKEQLLIETTARDHMAKQLDHATSAVEELRTAVADREQELSQVKESHQAAIDDLGHKLEERIAYAEAVLESLAGDISGAFSAVETAWSALGHELELLGKEPVQGILEALAGASRDSADEISALKARLLESTSQAQPPAPAVLSEPAEAETHERPTPPQVPAEVSAGNAPTEVPPPASPAPVAERATASKSGRGALGWPAAEAPESNLPLATRHFPTQPDWSHASAEGDFLSSEKSHAPGPSGQASDSPVDEQPGDPIRIVQAVAAQNPLEGAHQTGVVAISLVPQGSSSFPADAACMAAQVVSVASAGYAQGPECLWTSEGTDPQPINDDSTLAMPNLPSLTVAPRTPNTERAEDEPSPVSLTSGSPARPGYQEWSQATYGGRHIGGRREMHILHNIRELESELLAAAAPEGERAADEVEAEIRALEEELASSLRTPQASRMNREAQAFHTRGAFPYAMDNADGIPPLVAVGSGPDTRGQADPPSLIQLGSGARAANPAATLLHGASQDLQSSTAQHERAPTASGKGLERLAESLLQGSGEGLDTSGSTRTEPQDLRSLRKSLEAEATPAFEQRLRKFSGQLAQGLSMEVSTSTAASSVEVSRAPSEDSRQFWSAFFVSSTRTSNNHL